ncbi:MAG: 3-dehydroquinate synthase [Nitrospirae bacterium]|nr:3-dehydroquinate synthase [Nitrospirota bacterium]
MLIHSKLIDYRVDIQTKLPDPFQRNDQGFSSQSSFFVIDQAIYDCYPELFKALSSEKVFIFDVSEESKTMQYVFKMCEKLLENRCQRRTTLVAIGGGILQDVAGFVASIYFRGIPWIFYPTTLLAQADSCIGGKTSLNFLKRKNLLGTFYPPERIVICLQFLQSLSEKEFRSGIGEVIKLHIISGEKKFDQLFEKKESLFSRDLDSWGKWIQSSLEIKKSYIETDEHDLGLRKTLNFGHTCGHAIEACTHYEIPHGQAVLMGIIIACEMSFLRGMLSESKKQRVEALCEEVVGDLIPLKGIDREQFFEIVAMDKKNEENAIVEILIDDNLLPHIVNDVSKEEIAKALTKVVSF